MTDAHNRAIVGPLKYALLAGSLNRKLGYLYALAWASVAAAAWVMGRIA